MMTYKCKMCGGALEISNNETVATCEYCGTKQTLPKLDDERRANLYDRASHFRRSNEFDKAIGIYEQILNEDNTDAEAYWSLVLCRYGIEYVEDPVSHKRVPTVNRTQLTSIFNDNNYKAALQYADGYQRSIYENEAKIINEIQKEILSISQKEESFDVFICYKETDNDGRRTPDSVLANELYHQLMQEGFKVFFARITLEDKLGHAYEPYIFAALNSAKVMVVLGTKPEFFKAAWVRNEWSRYLALIKQGQNKMLIPAYKDMDPYDLPEEFSHLQAQDISKLGFMQDLIRGIKKIIQTDKALVKEFGVLGGNTNIAPLLKRIFMFLEDKDWNAANEYCEKVLDIDPENALAYLGKLMAELKVSKQENLKDCEKPFRNSNNYQKIIRFADDELKTALSDYIEHINKRNKEAYLKSCYNRAKDAMSAANTENAYKEAAQLFEVISGYLDSAVLANDCYEKAEITRKDAILADGNAKMTGEAVSNYEVAIKLFESISGWKDADEKICVCQRRIEEIKAKEEADRLERKQIYRNEAERIAKRNKKIVIITIPIVCAIIAFIIVLNTVIIPNSKYNNSIALLDAGTLDDAYSIFQERGSYKDSASQAENIRLTKNEEQLKSAKVGDYIFWGAYEQDNNTDNGKEDIEWLVLEIKEDKALVISKYALDCKLYLEKNVAWESCSLREWLNNEFLNDAFYTNEKARICTVTVSVDENPKSSANPGNATQDQVFLLSITEANQYFSSDQARQCKPTGYAVTNGALEYEGNCGWWLRSPGNSQDCIANVNSDGAIDEKGINAWSGFGGTYAARPALWIDLNSSN